LWRSVTPRDSIRKLERAKLKVVEDSDLSFQAHRPIDFTGVSAPYEEPEKPEIHIKTQDVSVQDAVRIISDYLHKQQYI
jgi:adenylylsulfate kinase